MYDSVPLSRYGETFIEGNATRSDSADKVEVGSIELRFRYLGEAVRTRIRAKTDVCIFTERFFRASKELDYGSDRLVGLVVRQSRDRTWMPVRTFIPPHRFVAYQERPR